jgi:hypothetical protein
LYINSNYPKNIYCTNVFIWLIVCMLYTNHDIHILHVSPLERVNWCFITPWSLAAVPTVLALVKLQYNLHYMLIITLVILVRATTLPVYSKYCGLFLYGNGVQAVAYTGITVTTRILLSGNSQSNVTTSDMPNHHFSLPVYHRKHIYFR